MTAALQPAGYIEPDGLGGNGNIKKCFQGSPIDLNADLLPTKSNLGDKTPKPFGGLCARTDKRACDLLASLSDRAELIRRWLLISRSLQQLNRIVEKRDDLGPDQRLNLAGRQAPTFGAARIT